jgi:hypothetical protein
MIDFPISSAAAGGMWLSLPRCKRSRAATTRRCPRWQLKPHGAPSILAFCSAVIGASVFDAPGAALADSHIPSIDISPMSIISTSANITTAPGVQPVDGNLLLTGSYTCRFQRSGRFRTITSPTASFMRRCRGWQSAANTSIQPSTSETMSRTFELTRRSCTTYPRNWAVVSVTASAAPPAAIPKIPSPRSIMIIISLLTSNTPAMRHCTTRSSSTA